MSGVFLYFLPFWLALLEKCWEEVYVIMGIERDNKALIGIFSSDCSSLESLQDETLLFAKYSYRLFLYCSPFSKRFLRESSWSGYRFLPSDSGSGIPAPNADKFRYIPQSIGRLLSTAHMGRATPAARSIPP